MYQTDGDKLEETMGTTVQVRDLVIGGGLPKICVPVMGETEEELEKEILRVREYQPDLVEWRVDYFADMRDSEKLKKVLYRVRELLGNIPLVFTVRTAREGGNAQVTAEEYLGILTAAAETGQMDLLDVEISHGDDIAFMLITLAHAKGVKVIASSHDFARTPKKEEIIMRLCKMQELEADIPKLAVMPENERDVLVLLDATLTMKELHGETPIITMSMGDVGKVSRISGAVFGSAVTFGTVGKASAPGQIEITQLREILAAL